jgi:hypothetical protein
MDSPFPPLPLLLMILRVIASFNPLATTCLSPKLRGGEITWLTILGFLYCQLWLVRTYTQTLYSRHKNLYEVIANSNRKVSTSQIALHLQGSGRRQESFTGSFTISFVNSCLLYAHLGGCNISCHNHSVQNRPFLLK